MKIEKIILSLLSIGIQILIYFKEQEFILKLEQEFEGLFCVGVLQENKIVIMIILVLGYLTIQQNKINNGIKYFIIGAIIIQLASIYTQLPIDDLVVDNILISFTFLVLVYASYRLINTTTRKLKRTK